MITTSLLYLAVGSQMYAGMYTEFNQDKIKVYSDIKTQIGQTQVISNRPIDVTYKLGISYVMKESTFTDSGFLIGLEHSCEHMIDRVPTIEKYGLTRDRVYIERFGW